MSVNRIPLRKKLALNFHRFQRNNERKIHQLNYLFWECTLKCNLNCAHCGSDCQKDASINDMPSKDFFKALEQIKPLIEPNKTMIVLTGGEALLRKDIEEIGLKLYKQGFPWGIVSNGMLINKQRLNSLMNAGLRSITVSLDGLKESHNWLRGNKNSFDKAISAIKLISSVKDLKFDVVTCVSQKNFTELNQIKDLLIKNGLKEWRIATIFPIGRAKSNPMLQLKPTEFKELFDFIKQTRQENKINLNYGCEGFLGNYEGEVRDRFFNCVAGIKIASVLVDGSISACPNLRNNFIQGNIYKDNFADVWQHKYKLYRDRSWTKKGICADCKIYKHCEGNSLHLRDENTGELLFCHLKRIEEGEALLS